MDGLGLQPLPAARSPLSARAFGSEVLLGELIGRGGMSRVYRAWRRGSGLEVAVKILRDDLAGRPEAVQRFVRERDLLAAVASPHVVPVHDLVVDGDELGIVMDLVPGGHLRKAVRFPCPPQQAAQLATQIADGLAAVHATGVVHRDLKPENVLADTDPDGGLLLRLTDFGISRLVDAAQLTQTSVTGTPGYLAPEVAEGARATAAADVYALGVILYELCTGRGPFLADNPLVLILAHTRDEPPRPGGMPDALWHLLAATLAKDPTARPSAEEAARALRELTPGLSGLPTCTPPQPRPTDNAPATVAAPQLPPGPPSTRGTPQQQTQFAPHRPGGPPTGTVPSGPGRAWAGTPPNGTLLPRRSPDQRSGHAPGDGPTSWWDRLRSNRPLVIAASTGAVLLVLIVTLGIGVALTGADVAIIPIPSSSDDAAPTGPTAVVPPTAKSSASPPGASVITLPLPAADGHDTGPTRGSTPSARPSPTPSPPAPTLERDTSSSDDVHSSDERVKLTIKNVRPGAGTVASITVLYTGGRQQSVPLEAAPQDTYDVTVKGLTNGVTYEFTVRVCNSARLCTDSGTLSFAPYGAPEVRAPRASLDGTDVVIESRSVIRNSNPGETKCQLVIDSSPRDPDVKRKRSVPADEKKTVSFTGRPGTTYVATQSCSTEGVFDGEESSDEVTIAPPPSPSASTSPSADPPAERRAG